MGEKEKKFVRISILIPKQAIDFARKQDIRFDIQELTLSAISGYFRTFASLSSDSKFPWTESHKIAETIEESIVTNERN